MHFLTQISLKFKKYLQQSRFFSLTTLAAGSFFCQQHQLKTARPDECLLKPHNSATNGRTEKIKTVLETR